MYQAQNTLGRLTQSVTRITGYLSPASSWGVILSYLDSSILKLIVSSTVSFGGIGTKTSWLNSFQ